MMQEWKSKENAKETISKANGWSQTWTEKSTRKREHIYNRRNVLGTSVNYALVSLLFINLNKGLEYADLKLKQ